MKRVAGLAIGAALVSLMVTSGDAKAGVRFGIGFGTCPPPVVVVRVHPRPMWGPRYWYWHPGHRRYVWRREGWGHGRSERHWDRDRWRHSR